MNRTEARGLKIFFTVTVTVAACWLAAVGGPLRADTYYQTVLSDNPVAYWQFDDATSGNGATAADAMGSHDGSYVGGSSPITLTTDSAAAIGGTAMDLDGVDDYVNTTTLGNVGSSIGSGVTFEFWLNTTSTDFGRAFGTFNTGQNTSVVFGLNSNQTSAHTVGSTQLFLRRQGGGDLTAAFDTSKADLYDGRWHHVAWRLTDVPSGQFDVFVDATPMNLHYGSALVGSHGDFQHNMLIGDANNRGTPPNPFGSYVDAKMDEMAVYNRNLGNVEIVEHFNTAHNPAIADLMAWEPFAYEGGTELAGHPSGDEYGGIGFSGGWTTPAGNTLQITNTGQSLPFPGATPFQSIGVHTADSDGGENQRLLSGPGVDFDAEGNVYYVSALMQKTDGARAAASGSNSIWSTLMGTRPSSWAFPATSSRTWVITPARE